MWQGDCLLLQSPCWERALAPRPAPAPPWRALALCATHLCHQGGDGAVEGHALCPLGVGLAVGSNQVLQLFGVGEGGLH